MKAIVFGIIMAGMMSWFNPGNIGKSEKQPTQVQTDSIEFKTMTKSNWKSLEDALEQNAGLSFEKQLVFGEIIGTNSWQFDMRSGAISFGEHLVFPVQIIGSVSFNDNSWMWGWANARSGIPDELLKYAYELKKMGEEKNLWEFTEGHYPIGEGFEHKMGMIACGIFKAKSYYCANYGQGSLVVVIDSDQIPDIDKDKIDRVLSSFPQLIQNMELDHKSAFINYLIDRDFKLKIKENRIEGLKDGKIVSGDFDSSSRLLNLNGKL